MKLEQLINFVSIAETGSLSESSKLLFLSQPALSHSITALEKSLNVKLFFRSNKGMHLTEEGMSLLPYAKDICASVNTFYQSAIGRETCDKLFLVSFPAFSNTILLDIIIALKKDAPDLNINLKDSLLRQIPEQIRKFPGTIGFMGFAD